MNKYLYCILSIVLSALLCGICFDLGFVGISLAFGFISALAFFIMLLIYLDSGTKFVDVDNSRKIN